jgi:outer membrane protein assembly factor BamB
MKSATSDSRQQIQRRILLAWLITVSGTCGAWGQAASEPKYMNVFQPAPSDVRRPLMYAEKAVEEGRYSDAAQRLGQLLMNESLDDPEAQDYFLVGVEESETALVTQRLRAKAQRMIADLPPQGRQAYELQFGAQARALLDEALAQEDDGKLGDVIRRFFHTRAGYEACLLAGRSELAQGRPLAAALHLQRLADAPAAAAAFDPELSLLLATCWWYARAPEQAQTVLVGLKSRLPRASLRLGGREVAVFADDSQALAWLGELVGPAGGLTVPEASQWVMYRGNAQRNAKSRGSLPMMNFRWLVPTTIDREDEKVVERMARQYRDEGRAALPALQPLAAGNVVVMRTPGKLLGVDFVSGKRIWVWPPWEDDSAELYQGDMNRFRMAVLGDRAQELQQRIWDDALYGQISSDGQSVFVLDDLGFAPSLSNSARQMIIAQGGIAFRHPGAPQSSNQLVSLSLARQGAAQWIVGGENGEDEPKLAGAFFLGAPLPLRDSLYAIAEFNGEIRLVVLEAKTGRLQWQQQLAHADDRTIQMDAGRRLNGATPSYDGGVLVCPTSAGAVVGVDVTTRSLLWGFQYVVRPEANQQQFFGFAPFNAAPLKPAGSRWADATVTIAEGRVLVTAVESDQLYCLDVRTGRPAWPAQERAGRLYLACVHEGQAVFAGVDRVSAVRLSDGQPAWPSPVALSEAPSGRGFYSDQFYFLPTLGAELLKIDLAKGEIVQQTGTALVLGNLVCFRDEILSQGPDCLSVFWQSEPLRRHVEKVLAEKPDDVAALAKYGELLLQDEQRPQAIETFRKAHQLSPGDETVRLLLSNAILTSLREDFAASVALAPEVERLIDRPSQQSEYLRIMAGGWQRQGAFKKAFDAYQELAQLRADLQHSGGAAEMELEQVDRNWNIRADLWLQARIGELLRTAAGAELAAMEQTIQQAFDQALASGEAAALRKAERQFGMHARAEEVRLALARRLVKTGELLEAELLLSRLEESENAAVRVAAVAEQADLMVLTRQYDVALRYYRTLADGYGDTVCRDGQTGRQLFEQAAATAGIREAVERSQPWPAGQAEVGDPQERVSPTVPYVSSRRMYTCAERQRTGPHPPGLAVFYDQTRNAILIQDGSGSVLLNVSLGSHKATATDFSPAHFRVRGHLLLVSMGTEVVAIDMLRAVGAGGRPAEAILWRHDLVRPNMAAGTMMYQTQLQVRPLLHPWGRNRLVFADQQKELAGATGPLLDSAVYFIEGRTLICADPLTGETLWSREGLPAGSDLFGDEEWIFVVPPSGDAALVFHALDGTQTESRPSEPLANRWATWGRHVLAWKPTTASENTASENTAAERPPENAPVDANNTAKLTQLPLDLWLYDALTGDEIWRESLPAATRGSLVDGDEVALLQPDGRLIVRSLQRAEPVFEAQLSPEASLRSVHVLRSQDQYVIATNRIDQLPANQPQIQIRSIATGGDVPLVTGQLYAFDRRTGQPSWPAPIAIDQFGLPMGQPRETPVLLLLRQFTPPAAQGPRREQTTVLCLDRRDGKPLLDKTDVPAQTTVFELVADRLKQTVTIRLPAKTFVIKLSDAAAPAVPETPPATPPTQPENAPPNGS